MTAVRMLVLILSAVALAACSSTPDQPAYTFKPRKVTIITEPPGARVTQFRPFGQKAEELGVTPIVEREVLILTNVDHSAGLNWNEALDHASNLVVLIRKDGYPVRKLKLPIRGLDTQVFKIPLTQ